MTSPCEDCVCLPICSNKRYLRLFKECETVTDYLENYRDLEVRNQWKLEQLYKVLNPNQWTIILSKYYEVWSVAQKGIDYG